MVNKDVVEISTNIEIIKENFICDDSDWISLLQFYPLAPYSLNPLKQTPNPIPDYFRNKLVELPNDNSSLFNVADIGVYNGIIEILNSKPFIEYKFKIDDIVAITNLMHYRLSKYFLMDGLVVNFPESNFINKENSKFGFIDKTFLLMKQPLKDFVNLIKLFFGKEINYSDMLRRKESIENLESFEDEYLKSEDSKYIKNITISFSNNKKPIKINDPYSVKKLSEVIRKGMHRFSDPFFQLMYSSIPNLNYSKKDLYAFYRNWLAISFIEYLQKETALKRKPNSKISRKQMLLCGYIFSIIGVIQSESYYNENRNKRADLYESFLIDEIKEFTKIYYRSGWINEPESNLDLPQHRL